MIFLLEKYGASHIHDEGDCLRSTCPLHHGNNPTAFVWKYENKLWYCFTSDCGGGSIFDFIANVENIDIETRFSDVVRKTAEVLDINIESLEITQTTNDWARDIRQWLSYMSNRVMRENQPFDLSKLGSLYHINAYRDFTKQTIEHFEAKFSSVYNRIVVPLKNKSGIIIGVSMRRTEQNSSPKWLHRPKHIDTGVVLYNLDGVTGDSVIIVEGVFDVWKLHQIGIKNAAATYGAHLTEEQERIICSMFPTVILSYDTDEAGQKATRKAIKMLKQKCNLYVLDLDVHDPGELRDIEHFRSIKILKYYEWGEKHGY
jgi:DNA primase